MLNDFEKIAQIIYREYKAGVSFKVREHPSEENLVCFLEDKLPLKDKNMVCKHLLSCQVCAENLSTQLKIQPHLSLDLPVPLLEKIKKIVGQDVGVNILEIFHSSELIFGGWIFI